MPHQEHFAVERVTCEPGIAPAVEKTNNGYPVACFVHHK